jgi:hypothetical protein
MNRGAQRLGRPRGREKLGLFHRHNPLNILPVKKAGYEGFLSGL